MLRSYLYFLRYLKPLAPLLVVGLIFMTLSAAFSGFSIALLYPVFGKVFSETADPEEPVDLLEGLGVAAGNLRDNLGDALQRKASLDLVQRELRGDILDALARSDRYRVLSVLVVTAAILILLRTSTRYLYKLSIIRIELELMRRVRNDLFAHMMRLSFAFYTRQRTGDLVTRIVHDVEKLRAMVIRNAAELLFNLMQAVVFLALALYVDLRLTLLSVVALPLLVTVFHRLTRRLKRYGLRTQQRISEMLGTFMEAMGAIRIVIGYQTQEIETGKFSQRTRDITKSEWRLTRVHAGVAPLSELLSSIIALSVLWFGGRLVLNPESDVSVGGFMVFLGALLSLMHPVKIIGNAWGEVQRGLASAERVLAVFDAQPDVKVPADPKPLPPLRDGIRFEGVSFSYGDALVLEGVDLEIPKGMVVAVVGGSGAGKSTLLNLIPRFYDPTGGAVRWDGIDLRDVDPKELAGRLGLVTQDVILFDDSVRNNIAYGLSQVDEDRVKAAAAAAHAHDFIMELPNGYDTLVGERGVRLSGGQKQRIAIARALCRQPEVLLLDEATSSLDVESEELVQRAIANLVRDRTAVIVAHRLSTIQKADRIAVLDRGRIVELGTHESLLRDSGRYADLYRLQLL